MLKSLNWSLRFSILNRLKMICIAKLLWKRCWWAGMGLINIGWKIIRHIIDGWIDFRIEIGISHKIHAGSFGRSMLMAPCRKKVRLIYRDQSVKYIVHTGISYEMQSNNSQPSYEERIYPLIGNISMKWASML